MVFNLFCVPRSFAITKTADLLPRKYIISTNKILWICRAFFLYISWGPTMEDLGQWLSSFKGKEFLKHLMENTHNFHPYRFGSVILRWGLGFYIFRDNPCFIAWGLDFENHCSKVHKPQVKNPASPWLTWLENHKRKRSTWVVSSFSFSTLFPPSLLLSPSIACSLDAGSYSGSWRSSNKQNNPEF